VTLLQKTLPLLIDNGFKVYTHRFTPTNDGGVSFGQAVVASVNYLDL
jgi:hydrogenase maturation protein HypF